MSSHRENSKKSLNIRKWDSEFINPNHISFPESDQIIHRMSKNLTYYSANYLIFFALVFTIMRYYQRFLTLPP